MSLTEKRESETAHLREKVMKELQEHPVVGELISRFGARIREIKILKEL